MREIRGANRATMSINDADAATNPRVWLITGASSGFGRAIATAALDGGDIVVATARRPQALDDLIAAYPTRAQAIALDVTNMNATQVIDGVIARHGRIDVLVNNAGRTQVGALEETTEQELRYLFELHFFGPAALTKAVLPHMRRQGVGAVVQMSSVGGQITAAGFGAYCATKFALEGLTETLRDEVAPFGIRTLIVEPGAFRTGLFRADAAYASAEMPEYAQTVGPTRQFIRSNDGSQPGDPRKAATAILAALDADQPPLRLVLGDDAINGVHTRLDRLSAELAAWEDVGRRTTIT
jgi:NAD(P)-dependent dehydrogenase (short-subunit alcohol dehydrogenase family)